MTLQNIVAGTAVVIGAVTFIVVVWCLSEEEGMD